jgi:hypothetical protein
MKGIASTGAPKTLLGGWVDGWMNGWVGVKAVLRIAYSNQKQKREGQGGVGHYKFLQF